MLDLCRVHVGGMLGCVGLMLGHLGPILPPMLGLYWPYGEPCWAYVGAHVGPVLGHVEPKFGNLADFRPLSKTWKNTGF